MKIRFMILKRLVKWRGSEGFFIDRYFRPYLAPYLGVRKNTFAKAFELLESKRKRDFFIVETGTARGGMNSISTDGASTCLFDLFVSCYGGEVRSIDLDPDAVNKARRAVSVRTQVICKDSLEALRLIDRTIDCLYLDSLDVNWSNPEFSAKQALSEFNIVEKYLLTGSIVVIDDSPLSVDFLPVWMQSAVDAVRGQKGVIGKGAVLIPYLDSRSDYRKILHEYQCVYLKI